MSKYVNQIKMLLSLRKQKRKKQEPMSEKKKTILMNRKIHP